MQHAQETASKLTDWAGRAVQRAFAAHLDQHKEQTSPQELKEAKSSNIDLTGPKNDIASSETDRAAKKPENQTKQRHVEFLDTSLEGLNAAHHAIFEEEKTMERDMSTITDEMKEDILKLLELCGIPWIESPAEAEAQCAALEELGLVDGIVTEDSDVFVFGGRKVYKVSWICQRIVSCQRVISDLLPFFHRTFSTSNSMLRHTTQEMRKRSLVWGRMN